MQGYFYPIEGPNVSSEKEFYYIKHTFLLYLRMHEKCIKLCICTPFMHFTKLKIIYIKKMHQSKFIYFSVPF